MNRYLIFTSAGVAYAVSALCADTAIDRVETFSRDRVSCWFLGQRIPSSAVALN